MAIQHTVALRRAAERDSDAWRAFGDHDLFYHAITMVPEVLTALAQICEQPESGVADDAR